MNEHAIWFAMSDAETRECLCDSYSDPKRNMMAIAETAYIYANNALPEWAVVIERFEIIDGNYLFIHRDPDTVA